jgi:hypothetical protein
VFACVLLGPLYHVRMIGFVGALDMKERKRQLAGRTVHILYHVLVLPAVVPHPVTGQPVWFNLTHLAGPGWTEYADGAPIEPGESQHSPHT